MMGGAWKHFRTITYHKFLVARGCFKVGLYRQGLLHDMSKYSPTEFWAGAKYYQGTRSPNAAEREALGYSAAWIHHKGRNKHHYEYWTDYSKDAKPGELIPVPMPKRYVAEMIMDRIAACKVYRGKDYTDAAPLEYLMRGKNRKGIHEETRAVLEDMLRTLAEEGEEKTFRRIREELVQKDKKRTRNIRREQNTIH